METEIATLVVTTETVPLRVDADGVVRVGDTRVTLDTVVAAFLSGATPEEIVQQYPSLSLADVYSTISYYLRRRPEVDADWQRRHEEAQQIRKQIEAQYNPAGIRARLLARLHRTQREDNSP